MSTVLSFVERIALDLASGELDWSDAIPLQQLSTLKTDPRFNYVTSALAGIPDYLAMNVSAPSSAIETDFRFARRCCGDTTKASASVKITFDTSCSSLGS